MNNIQSRVLLPEVVLQGQCKMNQHGLIPYICPGVHSVRIGMGTSSLCSSPQCQLCCPKVGPECSHGTTAPKMLQHFLSHQPVEAHSLTGSIPASSQGNPSLSSFPPHQIIPWPGMTIAEQLQFELSLLCHTRKQFYGLH